MTKAWYHKHVKDPFVKRANKEGVRSRAAYKLVQMQEKWSIIQAGHQVIDLGSAPGAWSEALVSMVGARGKAVACDLLPMQPIHGVSFIQGDFLKKDTQQNISEICDKYHVIVSDMAPNLTGTVDLDQANMLELIKAVMTFADQYLLQDGHLVCKGFHGWAFEEMQDLFKQRFKKVRVFKPEASRSDSKEIYLIGSRFGV